MSSYTHCMNCQSQHILPDLAVQDAGAYPSGSHKITVEQSTTARLLGRKGTSSLLHAYVCTDCGYVALFAQNPEQFSST